ncbi:unnamed protein product [Allacma fusca]|uniref:DUF1279 domain-containing protein n=1 Tax=Allacma fusca TaxID=39272 RepID=A0A8J2LR07_9HEXA|nr:unnamed protein product [Allacma fusca]
MFSRFTRSAFPLIKFSGSSYNVGRFGCQIKPSRLYCTPPPAPPKKENMFTKLKTMGKEYWYVVIPVHAGTSVVWAGIFYEVAKSGVDIKSVMKWFGISENITEKIVSSGAGNLALTYALYKVATPARYTVTLGCSMWAINYLKKRGYITAKEGFNKVTQLSRDLSNKHRDKFLKKNTSNKPPPSSDQS